MISISKINKLILLASMGSLLSCGSDKAATTLSGETSILGNWKTSCTINTEVGVYESIQRININSDSVEIITEYYGHGNNDCSVITEINKHAHPYNIVGNKLMLDGGTSINFTFYVPGDVAGFNSISLCEFNNWQVGVEKSVLNKNCIPEYDFSGTDEITYSLTGNALSLTDSFNNTITTTK